MLKNNLSALQKLSQGGLVTSAYLASLWAWPPVGGVVSLSMFGAYLTAMILLRLLRRIGNGLD